MQPHKPAGSPGGTGGQFDKSTGNGGVPPLPQAVVRKRLKQLPATHYGNGPSEDEAAKRFWRDNEYLIKGYSSKSFAALTRYVANLAHTSGKRQVKKVCGIRDDLLAEDVAQSVLYERLLMTRRSLYAHDQPFDMESVKRSLTHANVITRERCLVDYFKRPKENGHGYQYAVSSKRFRAGVAYDAYLASHNIDEKRESPEELDRIWDTVQEKRVAAIGRHAGKYRYSALNGVYYSDGTVTNPSLTDTRTPKTRRLADGTKQVLNGRLLWAEDRATMDDLFGRTEEQMQDWMGSNRARTAAAPVAKMPGDTSLQQSQAVHAWKSMYAKLPKGAKVGPNGGITAEQMRAKMLQVFWPGDPNAGSKFDRIAALQEV